MKIECFNVNVIPKKVTNMMEQIMSNSHIITQTDMYFSFSPHAWAEENTHTRSVLLILLPTNSRFP